MFLIKEEGLSHQQWFCQQQEEELEQTEQISLSTSGDQCFLICRVCLDVPRGSVLISSQPKVWKCSASAEELHKFLVYFKEIWKEQKIICALSSSHLGRLEFVFLIKRKKFGSIWVQNVKSWVFFFFLMQPKPTGEPRHFYYQLICAQMCSRWMFVLSG